MTNPLIESPLLESTSSRAKDDTMLDAFLFHEREGPITKLGRRLDNIFSLQTREWLILSLLLGILLYLGMWFLDDIWTYTMQKIATAAFPTVTPTLTATPAPTPVITGTPSSMTPTPTIMIVMITPTATLTAPDLFKAMSKPIVFLNGVCCGGAIVLTILLLVWIYTSKRKKGAH